MATLIPLKAKYQRPAQTFKETRKGTVTQQQIADGFITRLAFFGKKNQSAKMRTGNSHGLTPKSAKRTLIPRRRSWGPF